MTINVSLMGGLGNQLFQLALGLNFAKTNQVNLIPILGNSRRNSLGEVEISSLNLSQNVTIQEISALNSRMVSLGLACGLRVSTSRESKYLIMALEKAIPIAMRNTKLRIAFARGGGSGISELQEPDVFYVGYFQSHKFAADKNVFSKLMNLSPKTSSQSLEEMVQRVQASRPILLHVRLTDYLRESSFGLPAQTYYREAIKRVSEACGDVDIWVFSDDPSRALSYLPKEFMDRYRLAPAFEETVHTFELMRHFSGFIVANSSFSWWAAHLRMDRNAVVIHPWPWFKTSLHDKEDLVPEGWIEVASKI